MTPPKKKHGPKQKDSSRGLLRDILGSPDRDSCPGVLPIVSLHPDDESAYLRAIEDRATVAIELSRRGTWHGQWAELDAIDLLPDFQRIEPGLSSFGARWHAGRPLVLPGVLHDHLEELGDDIQRAARDHDELKEKGALRRWLNARAGDLEPQFRVAERTTGSADPERDIEKVGVHWRAHPERPQSRKVKDLWLKTGWLSAHDSDESLRLRFSFGREGDDDASSDLLRHALVERLATACLPETRIVDDSGLASIIETLCGEKIAFGQHIAYWNSPEGGALFHHDSFGLPDLSGQLGVCYMQLSGRTAWLALSIADLAHRVSEFADLLAEGELDWVRNQLFRTNGEFEDFLAKCRDEIATGRELALPGCGSLGPLVNRGPEFSSFLADAGHAYILEAGDAILLPNHGYTRTAMHSVFCASDETGYSLSLAVRSKRDPEERFGSEA